MFKIEKNVIGFKGIFITHLYFYENLGKYRSK